MLGIAILFGCASALASLLPTQASKPPASTAPASTPPVQASKPSEPPAAGAKSVPAETKADPAAVKKAAAILDKVQRYYDATLDYSADFTQSYTRVALSKVSESSGRVLIKKPGMMRWEYKKPAEKLFVADGTKLYVYEPEEEQVIIDPSFKTAELSTSISFLWGEGRLADAFSATLGDPARYQAPKGAQVLELVPKKDATYAKLVLILDPKTSQVTESILFETSGNTNRFKFKNPSINTGLKEDTFKFTPPPGVEIIQRP